MNNFIQHTHTRQIYWKREKSPTLQMMTEKTSGHLHPDIFKTAFIIVINMRMNHLILSVYANSRYLLKTHRICIHFEVLFFVFNGT